MTGVEYSVVGGTTPTSTQLKPRVFAAGAIVFALVSTQGDFRNPQLHGPATANARGIASLTIDNLTPDTRYYYRLGVNGAVDNVTTGTFRTFPVDGTSANFRVAAASCAGLAPAHPAVGNVLNSARLSNHPVHSTILDQDPLMFVHMGDMHYYNIGDGRHVTDNGAVTYQRAFDDVMAQPHQHNLYRNVTTAYMYDDHDFGRNDSDSTNPNRAAAINVYRERWPHYPLHTTNGGNYQSWRIGRVRFVMLDVRADRSPNTMHDGPGKSMLGNQQKKWLANLLANDTTSAALVLVMGSQWMGSTIDSWRAFEWDRYQLTDIFRSTGWLKRMVIVSGDAHALAIDTGRNSHGGIPVFQFASLDSESTEVDQYTYDTGPSKPGIGQWGTLDIQDNGAALNITGTGWVKQPNGPGVAWKSHTHNIIS